MHPAENMQIRVVIADQRVKYFVRDTETNNQIGEASNHRKKQIQSWDESLRTSTFNKTNKVQKFRCILCDHIVLKKNYILSHIEKDHGISYFTCPYCKHESFSHSQAKSHLLLHGEGHPQIILGYIPPSQEGHSQISLGYIPQSQECDSQESRYRIRSNRDVTRSPDHRSNEKESGEGQGRSVEVVTLSSDESDCERTKSSEKNPASPTSGGNRPRNRNKYFATRRRNEGEMNNVRSVENSCIQHHRSVEDSTIQHQMSVKDSGNQHHKSMKDSSNQHHRSVDESRNHNYRSINKPSNQKHRSVKDSSNQKHRSVKDSSNQHHRTVKYSSNQNHRFVNEPSNQHHRSVTDSSNQHHRSVKDTSNPHHRSVKDSITQHLRSLKNTSNRPQRAVSDSLNQHYRSLADSSNQNHRSVIDFSDQHPSRHFNKCSVDCRSPSTEEEIIISGDQIQESPADVCVQDGVSFKMNGKYASAAISTDEMVLFAGSELTRSVLTSNGLRSNRKPVSDMTRGKFVNSSDSLETMQSPSLDHNGVQFSWILNGTDEQYHLALKHEKNLVSQWMRNEVVF